jgi:hypothetical protein
LLKNQSNQYANVVNRGENPLQKGDGDARPARQHFSALSA